MIPEPQNSIAEQRSYKSQSEKKDDTEASHFDGLKSLEDIDMKNLEDHASLQSPTEFC